MRTNWLIVGMGGVALVATAPISRACDGRVCSACASPPGPIVPPLPALTGPESSLEVPPYQSRPGAFAKIYLDFDGDFSPSWVNYQPGTTPAYTIDSDPTTFSAQELTNIHQIWSRVSEKFSPFNVNVTTVDPGNRNDLETLHVVIGGNGGWLGIPAGGVAQVGAFYNSFPNQVFVFSANLANGDPKRVGEASSHEPGHGFGLIHQSQYDANGNFITEYNPGNAFRAPVMGNSYNALRGLWWRGPTFTFNSIQDDLAAISGPVNGFGYRTDDHSNTSGGATPVLVQGASISAFGVIEQTSDVDYFSFETLSGEVFLNLKTAPFGAMLDSTLSLFDSSGELLTRKATSSLDEFILMSLQEGSYFLSVSSAGNYGDIGQYSLTGTIVPVPEPSLLVFAWSALLLRRR